MRGSVSVEALNLAGPGEQWTTFIGGKSVFLCFWSVKNMLITAVWVNDCLDETLIASDFIYYCVWCHRINDDADLIQVGKQNRSKFIPSKTF